MSFLSTCPVRGTTVKEAKVIFREVISIHVPREGHDRRLSGRPCCVGTFLSTCPVRGTTAGPT